jgi:1-deoxy-D-xylulose-5-phosphate synthase
MLLDNINSPQDIKKLSDDELIGLCDEIRGELIATVSKNGGHLASNLGVVELTVAIHRVFDSPHDSIIFDVGHQSYVHKLLTGRRGDFDTIRTENGLSGFMNPSESEHDPIVTGHSSNSISACAGIAKANSLTGSDAYSVAVIGDGALTGGMAFEALNNAGRSKDKIIVILNDNKMSISKNVGALARYLTGIRTRSGYIHAKESFKKGLAVIPVIGKPLQKSLQRSKSVLKNALLSNNIFEALGFYYLGPVDGNNLEKVIETLNTAKNIDRPVLVHVCTVKGKGYYYAEKNPKGFHGVSPFDIDTGDYEIASDNFSAEFGRHLCELAENDQKICAVTAAMTEGTGLNVFRERFWPRFFDVGIAEQHAVAFSAAMAAKGMRPVFAVYSSFLQRGYDQIIHDAAIANVKLTLAVDRAGIVGSDGATHQGIFDTAFLNSIPNVTVFAPSCYADLRLALDSAIYDYDGVTAVRYPRGGEPRMPDGYAASNDGFVILGNSDSDTVAVTYGRIFADASNAAHRANAAVCKMNIIKPLPDGLTDALMKYRRICFFEEGIKTGGIGEHLAAILSERGYKGEFKLIAVTDEFVPHMTVSAALRRYHLDEDSMFSILMEE